ncbi:hypothetical protein PI124_g14213 [Phytophthora idaei]|nr:hypothetical protein PI125_g20113 [Phytophthora idaei]KAG3240901.1 hypothetical protein PI124_g14213 [Phytophthora idaei]
MPIYTAFPKKKSPEQKSRVVVRGVDQVIADEDAGELEEKAAPSPSLLAENNTEEMEEKAEADPSLHDDAESKEDMCPTQPEAHGQGHEVMEDIAEENEPECEPEPVSPPLLRSTLNQQEMVSQAEETRVKTLSQTPMTGRGVLRGIRLTLSTHT